MNPPRRICVVTGSRAEYGILYWLLREICDDPQLQLQLVATGMHLAPEFGLTWRAIEADGFRIDQRVEMLLAGDSEICVTKSVGLGVIGFADALARLAPDVVVVVGDRFEILAAAEAAFLAGIPLAHISGGELTEGAVDDVIRHVITKFSRYHFVAAEEYRRRVIQLGEPPDCVFNVGDPALDNIVRLELLSREALSMAMNFDLSRPFFLTTYHPVTAGAADRIPGLQELLDVLDAFPQFAVVITRANADAGGRKVSQLLDSYAGQRQERVHIATSLGQLNYLSAMRHCAAVVGNSSSGIIEAPAMGKPTVNIGARQTGRLKATSIIDCEPSREAIRRALERAVSPEFQASAARTVSLYGNSSASARICAALKRLDLTRFAAKRFHDIAQ
jgi:UDP-N-acetylglucosamine 2-epimerase (non-hydrolysing)/GDP/UDP-N,N'-diacetylbacillosamine 2-epimerase (hydrolysing)